MINKSRPHLFDSKTDIYCFSNNTSHFKKLIKGGASVIQLRDKEISDSLFSSIAIEMLSIIKNSMSNAKIIINDRVDIAISIKAHGIHIGKGDENLESVLKRVPDDMIVGISVDTIQDAIFAENAGASYIGAGSIFKSQTKPDAYYMGIDGFKDIFENVNIPIVTIGGITRYNIVKIKEAGAKYFAIISDINKAHDIPARLIEYFKIIGKEIQ